MASTSNMPTRIDMHAHFLPPFYATACRAHGHAHPDGMPAVPEWSAADHLAMMDRIGIRKSILSISSPGTHLVATDDALARRLTRDCNAFAAALKRQHPDRFGFFAALPLPDVPGSLAEIALAAAADEEARCDGFVLETNHHGVYLGDARFDAVFAELNRRRARVFIHPTTPKCACPATARAMASSTSSSSSSSSAASPMDATPLADRYPSPMLEFFFDTARVVTNMFVSGTVRRCPDVRFVLPHLGGAFVPLLSRWVLFAEMLGLEGARVSEDEVRAALRRQFWFDLAGVPFPGQIRALMAGTDVTVDRLMYGSDYPFTKVAGVELLRDQMDQGVKELFSEEDIESLYYRNAEKLLAMN